MTKNYVHICIDLLIRELFIVQNSGKVLFNDNQLKQLNKAQKAEQRAVARRDKLAEENRETRKALKEMEEKLKDLKKLQKNTRELQAAKNLLKKIHDGIKKNS